MPACAHCRLPVILDPVELPDGKLCHGACLHGPRPARRGEGASRRARTAGEELFRELTKRSR